MFEESNYLEAEEEASALSIQVSAYKEALEEIAKGITCLGPGCPYCHDDNHPPSPEARIAIEALRT